MIDRREGRCRRLGLATLLRRCVWLACVVAVLGTSGCGKSSEQPAQTHRTGAATDEPSRSSPQVPDDGESSDALPEQSARIPGLTYVAIAPIFVPQGDEDVAAVANLVGEMLTVAIADHGHIGVVDRSRLEAVLREQNLTLAGLADPDTAAAVGRLVTADVIVSGSVLPGENPSQRRFHLNMVRVAGREVLGRAEADGPVDEIESIALRLAAQVRKALDRPLPPIDPDQLDDSPVGRVHLMRGVGFYYAGDPDRAVAYFLRAVRLDPRLQEARLWIARAYLTNEEKEKAQAELNRLAQTPRGRDLAKKVEHLGIPDNPQSAAPLQQD